MVPDIAVLQGAISEKDFAAFNKPAQVFHPETWFHFIGGNVNPEGITADLEAISKAGIEGVQFFHGQFGGPWPGVEPQIKCLSESWDEAVVHLADECKRLGLRFTMQNCPGWAMSGGPWILPEKAMRHLVWSRTDLLGGKSVSVELFRPQPSNEDWRDYRDVAVIAFPTPEGDTGKALIPTSIKTNREDLAWESCLRKEAGAQIRLEQGEEPAWVEVTFEEPVTLRTIELPPVQSFNHSWCYEPGVTIHVEAVLPDGMQTVSQQKMPQSNWQGNKPISLACSEVSSKTYRITIDHQHTMAFPYIQLFTAARKNNWEAEAAWVLRGLDRLPHPHQSKSAWIAPTTIVDLSGSLDKQGTLHWDAPEGRWTILRWGHVNTGKRNGPAPPEGTGWECDKLSPAGAEAHFAGYIGRLAGKGGLLADGMLQGMLLDSWECETQTWTPDMERYFDQLRGYRLRTWLPALAGYVIEDPETTTRFLRDWRSTINDLLVENFFGRMAELGHENGLTISFETASGDVFPGDILEYYKHADVPMCEFWQPRSEGFVGSFDFKPVKPCVSAARLYGKPRVAAEAFTSLDLTWNEHPGMLKHIADMHLAEGVTHLVFHTYTHNPRTDFLPPGTSFGSGIGTPFLRGQTWWKHMPKFTDYLARCSYLLERGYPTSDVLWYLGDEQDHKPSQHAAFPAGYKYDYCNPDILLNRLSVANGKLVTPEGLSYRLLWLRDCQRMLPDTLQHLVSLVNEGAIIVGERPQGLATLRGGSEAENRFHDAVATLWGPNCKGTSDRVRRVGKGCVISGMTLDEALAEMNIGPDVEGEGFVWTHRQVDGADWYFIAAPAQQGFQGTIRFRSTGTVELWDPMTGTATPAGFVARENKTSLVALDLPPSGSTFVVFNHQDVATSNRIVQVDYNGTTVVDAQTSHTVANGPQVLSASYGDLATPDRCMDVTDLVRRDLASGTNVIRASNDWAGRDPAPKTRKRISVVLRLSDATEKQLEAWEGEPLSLFDPTVVPFPACTAIGGEDACLLAWKPGGYRAVLEDGTTLSWESRMPQSITLHGPWTLKFPADSGGNKTVQVDELKSWTELGLPAELQSFSGTAVYLSEFTLQPEVVDMPIQLDLGRVADIAVVRINGKQIGCVWTAPYRLDISDMVKPGVNKLSIEVTNTWFNRLVYDARQSEDARKTWTIKGPAPGRQLVPSGLLGPAVVHIGEKLVLPTISRQNE